MCDFRERSDGLHRPIAYLAFKIFGEAAVMVLISLCTTLLVFYTVRLAGSYFYFWIVYLLTSLTGVSKLPRYIPNVHC